MLAYNYRIVIPPKHEAVLLEVLKNKFIGGYVEIRIGRVVFDAKHKPGFLVSTKIRKLKLELP